MEQLVDTIENLMHGTECSGFDGVHVTRGTPQRSIGQWASAGTVQLQGGTIEFRDRATGNLLVSMSATSDTKLTQTVGPCRVVVTPADLQGLVRLDAWRYNGRTLTSGSAFSSSPQTLGIPGYRDQFVRHGDPCPAFAAAQVVVGSPAAGTPTYAPMGEQPLPIGTITFRHRTTKAALATMSTVSGAHLAANVGESEMVVTPARLEARVQVKLWVPS